MQRKPKQAVAVIGGLFALLVVLCAILYRSGGRGTQANPPINSDVPAISTWLELRSRAEAESIVVRGRCGLPSRGLGDALAFPGVPPLEEFCPQFNLTLSDGTIVTCSFAMIRAEKYREWVEKHPIGSVVTIRGMYWPSAAHEPQLLTHCSDVP